MNGKDDKSTDPAPPAADPGKDDKSTAPPAASANPPAPDPEAERTRAELAELAELRAYKAKQEADAQAAEQKRLEEAGEFEKVKAQLAAERAQVEANFRTELAARDIRSHVLEHLAEAHRDKVDLLIPSVRAAAGELKWDGLTLKTDVAKAARETIRALGFGVAADDKGAKGGDKSRRQSPPPPAPRPEPAAGGGNPPPKPAHVPMRDLVREAVEDVLGSKSS